MMLYLGIAVVLASLLGGSVATPFGLPLPVSQADCKLAARSNSSGPCLTGPQRSGNLTTASAQDSSYKELIMAGYDELRQKIKRTEFQLESVFVGLAIYEHPVYLTTIALQASSMGREIYDKDTGKWTFDHVTVVDRKSAFTRDEAYDAAEPVIAYSVAQEWAKEKSAILEAQLTLENNTLDCPAAGNQLTWSAEIKSVPSVSRLYIGAQDNRPYTADDPEPDIPDTKYDDLLSDGYKALGNRYNETLGKTYNLTSIRIRLRDFPDVFAINQLELSALHEGKVLSTRYSSTSEWWLFPPGEEPGPGPTLPPFPEADAFAGLSISGVYEAAKEWANERNAKLDPNFRLQHNAVTCPAAGGQLTWITTVEKYPDAKILCIGDEDGKTYSVK